MIFLLDLLLYALALVGHAALWTTLVNRVHATPWPKMAIRLVSGLAHACTVSLPFVLLLAAAIAGPERLSLADDPLPTVLPKWLRGYLGVCCLIAIGPVAWTTWRRRRARTPDALQRQTGELLDLSNQLGNGAEHLGLGRWMTRLPGNEVLQVEVTEKTLALPRLPETLDGFTIAHLSDLHFTGRIAKEYFCRAVELVNRMQPDLIALTGDLVENTLCIDWVAETLGKLRSRFGTYYVLGNHDVRIDVPRLREALARAGLESLGGRWIERELDGQPVVLAGNELPWVRPAADMSTCPHAAGDEHRPLHILLAHSPDQYAWARERGFDLMLAGHTHGGQIVLPMIGALICPSRYGTKYASGVFDEPPTVMHVSRGLSGELPIRWRCPPEITRIVLTRVNLPLADATEQLVDTSNIIG